MTGIGEYIRILAREPDWDNYLLANSGLPGIRANIELMHAVGS